MGEQAEISIVELNNFVDSETAESDEFYIEKDEFVIGRSPESDVRGYRA